jgi:photosystem II stability/assembly factor-like uncharacterized protein
MRVVSRRSWWARIRILLMSGWATLVPLMIPPAARTAIAQSQSGVWEPLGPSAGTVFALEPNPFDGRVLLAGSYFGGLYRSADYGITWRHLPSPFASRLVLTLAHAPSRSGTVYVGTFQDGLYRTLDGGTTWEPRNSGLPEPNIQAIAVHPLYPDLLLAATAGSGVFRSDDGGGSWRSVLPVPARVVLFDPRTPSTALAGGLGQVYRSLDGGSTWTPLGTGLNDEVPSSVIVDQQQAGGYLATTPHSVFRYEPAQNAWRNVRENLPLAVIHQVAQFPGSHAWFATTDQGVYVNVGTPQAPWWQQWATFSTNPRQLLFTASGALAHVTLRHGGVKATLDFGQTWFDAAIGMQNLFTGALATRAVNGQSVLFAGDDLGIAITSSSFGTALGTVQQWMRPVGFDEGVFRIVPHPTQPQTTFAGTERAGVWKSADWGQSWTQMAAGLYPKQIFDLAQSPANRSVFYAGSTSGIYRSADGGHTWKATATRVLHPSDVRAVATHPREASVAYFAAPGGQVFRTFDDGDTFYSASMGLPAQDVEALDIADGAVYARTKDYALYVADDDGGSWTNAQIASPVVAVQAHPTRSRTAWIGTFGGGVLASIDGGPWLPFNDGLTLPYVFSLAIDATEPSTMFAGGYVLYRSTTGGTEWQLAGAGLPWGPIVAMAVDHRESQPRVVYAEVDGFGVYRSLDDGATFMPVGTTSRGPLLVDAATGDVLLGVGFGGILRSSNAGTTWTQTGNGVSIFTRGLAVNPGNPNVMYAGSLHGGVYVSDDGGASWAVSGVTDNPVQDIAIDPITPSIVYAGTTNGIARSLNGGASWTGVGPFNGAGGGFFVLAVVIDPATPSTVYAGTGGNGVWKSTDRGTTWTAIGAGLTNPLVLSMAIDPAQPQTIYAGTAGSGVFVSDSGGAGWQPLGAIPHAHITSLALDPINPSVIYAGTEGGGVYRLARH